MLLDQRATRKGHTARAHAKRNALSACPADTCTALEEQAILTGATAGTLGTDTVDGDPVSFGALTLDAGDQSQSNGQVDVPANSIWALTFDVRVE